MKKYSKGIIAGCLVLVALFSIATSASAMSLQVRGGGVFGSQLGDGTNVGADLFLFEGKAFDVFVGYDNISASVQVMTDDPLTKVDSKTDAFILGLRYKFQTTSSWTPYVSLGLTSTKTTFTFQPGASSRFQVPKSGRQVGQRLGLGVDYGMSDNWSLGMEVIAYRGIQCYEDELDSASLIKVNDGGFAPAADLELRYHF